MNTRRRLIGALAIMGAIALLLGLVGSVMGLLMLKRGFSARDEPSAAEAAVARAMRTLAIPGRYEELANPVAVTPTVIASAKAHWADHCASCHANDGSGQTGIGKNLFPRAPDMRADVTQKMSDGQLYYIIENGIRLTGMPAWGDGKDDNSTSWELVGFIRMLPRLTPGEVEAIKALNPRSASAVKADAEDESFLNADGNDAATPPSQQGPPQ